jgi:tetratricopeptide (TPR) repeat protein
LYEQGSYKEAIEQWLAAGSYESLSASTLYNIGNACYRAGSQGQAALYFRRALIADPQHVEARQNLRFLERKFGALTIKRPEYQYKLTQIPESWFTTALFACAWAAVIGLLIFPATRSGSKLRIAAIAALVIAPLLSITCAIGRHYYPDDSQFAPYSEQAVIVIDKATIYADASRSAGKVIEAPGGSLCRVIQRSDRWIYVAFATQTRGWIPAEQIEPLIPTSPPTVPSFQAAQKDKGPSA